MKGSWDQPDAALEGAKSTQAGQQTSVAFGSGKMDECAIREPQGEIAQPVGFLGVKLAKDRLDQALVLVRQFRSGSIANKRVFHVPLLAARLSARGSSLKTFATRQRIRAQ